MMVKITGYGEGKLDNNLKMKLFVAQNEWKIKLFSTIFVNNFFIFFFLQIDIVLWFYIIEN